MKTLLIVYVSRTGRTRRVAEQLGTALTDGEIDGAAVAAKNVPVVATLRAAS